MTDRPDSINHDLNGKGRTGAVGIEVQQACMALNKDRDLASNLMQELASVANLERAFTSVKRNKGAPGVDKVSIKEVECDLDSILESLAKQLREGQYKPSPVRGVEIPKPTGGSRQLGIPTVIDRIVQQAISQVLTPIFDPLFSEASFGFRPKRSARQAIEQAKQYVKDGRPWVVDIDLEKFFDKVNHDILMSLVAKQVQDKAVLTLIRRFLTAGMMQNGVCSRKDEGTPQGGPLSPLLSNIMLHELDKELHSREHAFCRYADDCNIYLQSQAAGERVLASITNFIEKRLKLKVNPIKSAVDTVNNRKFLGFRLRNNGDISIAPTSLRRLKDKIRKITKRNRGVSLTLVTQELNQVTRGWLHYFKCADSKTRLKQLDGWIRRRLRCYRLKQRKRKYSINTFLQALGIPKHKCWSLAGSDRGWWRKALHPVAHQALSNQWFKNQGLFSLYESFVKHKSETAVCDIARTVV